MQENITELALKLAIRFSDQSTIPTRFKRRTNSGSYKGLENSAIERKFQECIKKWENIIINLTNKTSVDQANRYLNIDPNIEDGIKSAARCGDFIDLNDYLIVRKSDELCSAEEIGMLSQLLTAIQVEVELRIKIQTQFPKK